MIYREKRMNGDGEKQTFDVVAEKDQKGTRAAVTVVVSVYNHERSLPECLDSVKSQTLDDVELIVIDDGSTDGSVAVVRQWLYENGNRFPRYVVGRHRKNGGVAAVRNRGFAQTRTNYLLPLDATNLIYPRCLQQLLSALDRCHASFAYCYVQKIGAVSRLKNTRPWNPLGFQHGNTIDPMVLHRKSTLDKVGGYSIDMPAGLEDFDLWFKIARQRGWGILVPEILATYRVHDPSRAVRTIHPNADRSWAWLKKKYPDFFTGHSALRWKDYSQFVSIFSTSDMVSWDEKFVHPFI